MTNFNFMGFSVLYFTITLHSGVNLEAKKMLNCQICKSKLIMIDHLDDFSSYFDTKTSSTAKVNSSKISSLKSPCGLKFMENSYPLLTLRELNFADSFVLNQKTIVLEQ